MEQQYDSRQTVPGENLPGRKKNSDMATASMVLGILGIMTSCACCLGVAISSIAVILGLLTRTEPQMERNARIGVITGGIGLGVSLLFIALWLLLMIGA